MPDDTMTPSELRQCLLTIDLSARALGRHIGMGEGMVRARTSGKREIEPEIATWLQGLFALSKRGPFPSFEVWSAPGPDASAARQEALFARLRTLGWSIEEFSRHLRIERPSWDDSELVPDGAALVQELLRVHGWEITDLAARFDLVRADPDILRFSGMVEMIDGREVTRMHVARLDRVLAVQRGAAALPREMADWIKQRLALHRMTRAQGPIPDAVLLWLDSRIALHTTWPKGFEPSKRQAMAEDTTDPLTGGSLA